MSGVADGGSVAAADSGPVEGGHRRVDRVLGEDYLAGLGQLPLAELRGLRAEAEQEETDLSYLRRLIQGRTDVISAELARREGGAGEGGAGAGVDSDEEIRAFLSAALAEEPRAPARGLGRHQATEPSRADQHRRRLEAMVADVDLSDVRAQDGNELRAVIERLRAEEASVSTTRKAVQGVLDACSAEVTRRYRDGEASVDRLLDDAGATP